MILCLTSAAAVAGCAPAANPADPWEKMNRHIYSFNEGLDKVALKPAADTYTKVIPAPVRTSIGNAFDNLVYLDVVLNDFLQQKWKQGADDTGRFAVNSTVGVVGFFDVASKWKLPPHKNDFGLTLRHYGAKPGPYLVIPLLGPSTVIDSTDYPVTYLVTPTSWYNIKYYVTIPLYVTDTVDLRSRYESIFKFRNESAVDPYVFTREGYLSYREKLAHPDSATGMDDIYDQDMSGSPPTPTTEPTDK